MSEPDFPTTEEQIEQANASGKTPVVFIHGLWLLPSSWDRWADVFAEAGYVPLTPGWPDDPDTVEEANDHPEVFASEDSGATPVEIVLAGLAGCLTAGIAAVAQARDVQLRSVKATLEAGMDIRGILGADPDVRNGFDGIKVTYKIDADASPEDIKAIVAQSQKRSAVYDIITNPTNVTVEVK